MALRIAIASIFIISLYPLSSATIINIPADWPTIQQGIDASIDGDTVLVQPGTYVENINFNGHNIVLGSLFLTTGDTSYINQTVIDGDSAGTVVTFESGESSFATIFGFSIYNGNNYRGGGICCDSSSPSIISNVIAGNYDYYSGGGGIYCNYSSSIISNNRILANICNSYGAGIACNNSSPIINNNILDGNLSAYDGGAIGCKNNSSPHIIANAIINNITWYWPYEEYGDGGGIACISNSNPIIYQNIIAANQALFMGGGIYCEDSAPIILLNTIYGNSVGVGPGGGGIACDSSNAIIANNVITGNSDGSAGTGGAIHIIRSDPTISNNIIKENETGGIACWWYSNPVLINNIIRDNNLYEVSNHSSAPAINYCNIQGGWPGTGNIDLDPLFRDPDNGDFHLMSVACGDSADSPCIDAGDPAFLDSLLDCSWGLGGPRSDMGAYGGGDSLITTIFENISTLPDRFMLLQNYPNPFNAQTSIRFVLPEPGDVQITIYDLLGRRVGSIIDEYMEAGAHTISWNATTYPSGVYFARMETKNATKNIKMLLLK